MPVSSRNRSVGRLSILAILIATAMALAACGATDESSSDSGSKASAADATIPASGCGSVALPLPKDPDGVLAELPEASQKEYAGYPNSVTESVWADFKPNHPPPYKVGLAFASLNVDSQVKIYESLKKTLGNDPDIEFTGVSTGSQLNIPQQLQQFQSLLDKKPDLMIVEPLTDAFGPLVEKAAKQNIPTLSIQGTTVSKSAINMESNNYGIGAQGASVGFRMIGGKGNALYVHGIASSVTDQVSFKAYQDALKTCPGIKQIGEIAGAFVSSTAKAETLKFLATHPEPVDVVVNTGAMAPGILSAFEQAGRPIPVVVDRGAMKGSLGFWNDDSKDYNGFAQGAAPTHYGVAISGVVKRILAGRGLKVSEIESYYVPITNDNLGDWAESGWNLNTPGISEGPADPPQQLMSEEFISTLFKDPAPADDLSK